MTNNGSNRARPTVAVIIPYYNGSKWIARAIKSVVTQTIPPDEFVIVNDGSKPEERAALDPLAQQCGFRILDKENGGQGSARNFGVWSSTAEYICFLDQDDFYLPSHIEDLLDALPEKNDPRFGFVYADLCEADGDGNIVHSNMLRQQLGSHPKAGHIAHLLRHDMFVLPSASLIERKAFNAVGGFDPQFMGYEDDDLFIRLFRAGHTNYFLDKPVTVWCMHTGSTSWSVKMSRSRFRYFKKLAASFQDDAAKNLYYFRDCLMPRFGRAFIVDAIQAAKKSSDHRDEVCQILREYCVMVCSRPEVGRRQKLKLRIATFLLTNFSAPVVRAFGVAYKTPLLRRIAMRLL